MNANQHFLTFLKRLHTPANGNILESIEKGFRHVLEGTNYGNIYNSGAGIHPTPTGDILGTPAPADMITEDSEESGDDGAKSSNVTKDVPEKRINVTKDVPEKSN